MRRPLTVVLVSLLVGCSVTSGSDAEPEAKTFMAAAIQAHSRFGEPAANREKLGQLVRQAARHGARVIVLPETAVTGYLADDLKQAWQLPGRELSPGLTGVDPREAAEAVPGPSCEFFGKLAAELGVYVTVPLLEIDRKTGFCYNTSLLFDPEGRMLIHYRKRNPWPWAELGWGTPGDLGNPVVDTEFGRLGLLICFDIHKQAAVMSRLKVDTLLYSIAWVDDEGSDWYDTRLPEIARRSGMNIVAANWTVPKQPAPMWHGYGQSRIIDSAGVILAKVEDDLADEIVYAELPIARDE